MTHEEAQKVIDAHPDAINLVKPSHLHKLSDLVEVHVEIVKVRRDECTSKYEKGGSIFSPSDVAINRIGTAAGIEFEPQHEATRKIDKAVWVGSSQGKQRAPDGTFEYGAPCEYEWDAELRVEELKVKGKKDWSKQDASGQPGRKEYTPQELAENFLDFRKFGCQRANTGARARAIVFLLGMKRGIKGLFPDKGEPGDTREFLVSRIIVNAKNAFVMKAMVANLGANAGTLYGPTAAQAAIAAPSEEDALSFNLKAAEDQQTTGTGEAEDEFDFSDDPEISGAATKPTIATDQEIVDGLVVALEEWSSSDEITQRAKDAINEALKKNIRDRIVLEDLLRKAKANAKALKEANERKAAARKAS